MNKLSYLVITVVLVLAAAGCSTRPFTPGSYIGTAPGMLGNDVVVDVLVDAWSIKSIKIIRYNEPLKASSVAFESIPKAIIEGQSLDVAPVPGALGSSRAIINAVANALHSASSDYGLAGSERFFPAASADGTVAVLE